MTDDVTIITPRDSRFPWQNALAAATLLITLVGIGNHLSEGLTTLRDDNKRAHEISLELKETMVEVRLAHDREADQQLTWRNDVVSQLSDMQRHLDRLDYAVGGKLLRPINKAPN